MNTKHKKYEENYTKVYHNQIAQKQWYDAHNSVNSTK